MSSNFYFETNPLIACVKTIEIFNTLIYTKKNKNKTHFDVYHWKVKIISKNSFSKK